MLFGGVVFALSTDYHSLTYKLQADELYDIYAPEVITLTVTSLGVASRVTPRPTDSNTSFVIQPTQGKYFLSGSFSDLTVLTLQTAAAQRVKVVLTLYGERWAFNASYATTALLDGITSQSALYEDNGFTKYKSTIISPQSAELSADHRVL